MALLWSSQRCKCEIKHASTCAILKSLFICISLIGNPHSSRIDEEPSLTRYAFPADDEPKTSICIQSPPCCLLCAIGYTTQPMTQMILINYILYLLRVSTKNYPTLKHTHLLLLLYLVWQATKLLQ